MKTKNSTSTTTEANELWPAKKFAEYMGWTFRALKHRIETGSELPPAIRIGTRYFFRPATVQAWLEGLEAPLSSNKGVA